jgi:nitrite reductase (NO-forming)
VTVEATRTRCRRRPIDPGAPRPSKLLACFFTAGIGFVVVGAVAAVADVLTAATWLHWLSLHLVFLGGVSQLVLGAGQFFTCAFLATSPPSRRFVGFELGAWNAGVVLVAVGVPTGLTALVDAGGASVVIGLVLFAAALRGMQRRSLQRARWAVRWYQACATCLGTGAVIGVAMARDTAWSYGSLLGAHLTLNIAGWMGTAIVGTLHTLFPSLTQTRLRLARLQGPTFVLWAAGVWVLAAGAAFGADAVMVAGWVGLGAAATLLSVNLLASLRRAPRELALPARLIALGQLFLPIGIAVALGMTFARGADAPFVGSARSSLAALLLIGWIGLTVAGSLLHLLAVLARVRAFTVAMPGPRPRRDRLILVAAGVAVIGLALGDQAGVPVSGIAGWTLAIAVAGVLGADVGALLVRAIGPTRRRRPPAGTRSA